GFLLNLLQRLAGGDDLRAMELDLREHRAQSGALFLRGRNQRLKFIRLLTRRTARLESVEHENLLEGTLVCWGTVRIAFSGTYRNFSLRALVVHSGDPDGIVAGRDERDRQRGPNQCTDEG